MQRPLLLRILPDRLKSLAFQRLYSPTREEWMPLYQGARLHFSPEVRMDLVPGDIISDPIALTGIWRLHFSRHLRRLAKHGGLMVDVGANLGYFSLLWASATPANACISFEPSPRNVELLRRNVASNHLDERIRVVPHAAGRDNGIVPFDAGPDSQTGWGALAPAGGGSTIPVETVRVDEIVGANTEVALLKIDTQGSDVWVLSGCEGLLRNRKVRQIWFEQNRPRMRALGIGEHEAVEFLKGCGYHARPQSDPAGDVVEWSATLAV